ncbi:hypothetical protein SEA_DAROLANDSTONE_42 [Streptomyces phage Darolandstone]|uniref:Uncharacterized protein n=1 Tax=Streptomyces phage Darolandstone TaxID=2315716 RepID=A0A386KLD0_9CAUD|nr:hypothetical protein HOU27_gp42 [Streptomyces phage Darolandstone]AYD86232.1 hypothetical protein SEA_DAROLANDSTONE_42 [Streptomyces phage Darolandstone]
MMPDAALAAIRAAVEVAHGNGLQGAEDVAEAVAGELTAVGWTLTLDEPENDAQAAA